MNRPTHEPTVRGNGRSAPIAAFGKEEGDSQKAIPPEAFRTIPCPTYHPDFSNCCATIGIRDKRVLLSTSSHYALSIFLPHHLLKALRTAFFFAADMPLATTFVTLDPDRHLLTLFAVVSFALFTESVFTFVPLNA